MTVDCPEFLDRYSDFRDSCMDAEHQGAFEGHLRVCASCARYDQVVRNGVRLLAETPEIQPSEDFFPRLQHRIFHLEDAEALAGQRASGASLAAIGIAAAFAFAAWTPSLQPGRESDPLPVALVVEGAAYGHWPSPAHPVALHGPIAPALQGSGAELLLWSPVQKLDPGLGMLTAAGAGIP